MNETLLPIAESLSLGVNDLYIIAVGLLLFAILVALSLDVIYQIWFGIVVGLAIYMGTLVLLSPTYSGGTPLLGEWLSKFLIGSSLYMVVILAVLVPLNRAVLPTPSSSVASKVLKSLVMGVGVVILMGALFIAMIEGTSIFIGSKSIFSLMKDTLWYRDHVAISVIGMWLIAHAHAIIAAGVGYMVFLILFEDIVWVMLLNLYYNIRAARFVRASQWGGHGGGQSEHAGHDEGGGHDEHAHGGDEHGHGGGHH